MSGIYRSYRGVAVDMNAIAKKAEKTIALGNAHLNGRGDLIGRGGKIIKTREQQLAEYAEANVRVSEESVILGDVDENLQPVEQEEIKQEDAPAVKKPVKKTAPKKEVMNVTIPEVIMDGE